MQQYYYSCLGELCGRMRYAHIVSHCTHAQYGNVEEIVGLLRIHFYANF
jgi:hypothetical protein